MAYFETETCPSYSFVGCCFFPSTFGVFSLPNSIFYNRKVNSKAKEKKKKRESAAVQRRNLWAQTWEAKGPPASCLPKKKKTCRNVELERVWGAAALSGRSGSRTDSAAALINPSSTAGRSAAGKHPGFELLASPPPRATWKLATPYLT